jgi:nitric oxide reductase NorQ protein
MKINNTSAGFIDSQIYKVELVNGNYQVIDTKGSNVGSLGISTLSRKAAYNSNMALHAYTTKTGKQTYRRVPMSEYNSLVQPLNTTDGGVQFETPKNHTNVKDFIHNTSISLKPVELVMNDLKWKYLIRSAVRAKNIMMTGPAGCGKTMAAKALVKSLNRPDYYFNLGATQDPRSTLIGNTHFDKNKGTFFSESSFVKAIKTPNAVILLDELTRAHPDAWNILMTVLDQNQRYLRLDEQEGSPIVNVAEGVTFIATANIGNEYTATRVLDRALLDRFVIIEMDVLSDVEELELLKYMFPLVDVDGLAAISQIAHHTRQQSTSDSGKVTSMISTRGSVEVASLLYDGFSLMEAAEIAIFPFFSADGGLDSERTYVKQLIQKYISNGSDETLFENNTDSSVSW